MSKTFTLQKNRGKGVVVGTSKLGAAQIGVALVDEDWGALYKASNTHITDADVDGMNGAVLKPHKKQ